MANGAAGSGGQEIIGPDGEPVKKWERPWSVAEMKQECQQWTLAADAGVGRKDGNVWIYHEHKDFPLSVCIGEGGACVYVCVS